MRKMELLAPAGGPEQLGMALHFGADAVYLAGRRWGMRSASANFGDDELAVAVARAHAAGARVHVTVNAMATDADTDGLPAYLRLLDEAGVDAVIVGDLGVMALARAHAPHVELHVSTQASCMNSAAAEQYLRLGARRVVLAREMTLAQIAELRRRTSRELELEVFAHGSMCMAVSGRCLLSSEMTGGRRAATFGDCAQPCRWEWGLVERRTPGRELGLECDGGWSHLMSADDLCMVEHLDELAAAGVDSIKVEGRAKGAYYAAAVTNAYRHVLDGDDPAAWRRELDMVSHRPYSTGFFFGNPTQSPRVDGYARDRLMVAVVTSCEPVAPDAADGPWRVGLTCRNRAEAGCELDVLSPGQSVRRMPLAGVEAVADGGGWVAAPEGLARSMDRYRATSPWPLQPGDLLCRRV
ncbi:peptidase U32 family protein [Atopobiaceae bacterium LCP21S3_F11]